MNERPHSPSPGRLHLMGMVAWPAFVFAGVATMLFFASFDPEVLARHATFGLELSRTAGYTLGFLLFWVFGMVCTLATLFLLAPYIAWLREDRDDDRRR